MVMGAGQVMAGGSVSLTVTVKVHVAVFPDASVAVQVTVVVPFGKAEPEAGEQLVVTPGQLSLAAGAKVTTAEHWPGSVDLVMFAGHAMVGLSVSLTVTVKVQVAVFPDVSVAVQVTVVVPFAKVEPEAGEQLVVTPGQLSLAVGL